MTRYRTFSLLTQALALWLLFSVVLPGFAQTPTLFDIYAFNDNDGAAPYASLIQASDGNFYGTTFYGGVNDNGTVFKITSNGVLTVLHTFADTLFDGAAPYAGLIQAKDGNLYGATEIGGVNNYGTIFKITPDGTLTTLYSFSGSDGTYPRANLIQASDGNFYSAANEGGANNYGTIFKITPSGTLTTLYSFSGSDGAWPGSALIQASDGNIYGATWAGGANKYGTVFKITPGGALTTLHEFSGGSDGGYADSALIQANDGNLYGTTYQGGLYNKGTLFRITPDGALTTIHSFNGTDGTAPYASLIQASDGNLYGTTYYGGASNYGTVYVSTTGGTLFTIHSFNRSDGAYPWGGLTEGKDGLLNGITAGGGANGYGAVFALYGDYPFPSLSGLSPASTNTGGPAFTLSVKGSFFQYFSTVHWNGASLNTTFVSPNQLKASVPASLIASPGKATITVITGAGGGTSNSKIFTILLTTLKLTAASLTKNNDGSYTANITLKNVGYNIAPTVKITKATLGAATSTTLPVTVDNIAAGSTGNTSLAFPASSGASGTVVTMKVSGTFSGGKFSGSLKVTLP